MQPPAAPRGKQGHHSRSESVGTRAQQKPVELARPRRRWANAQEAPRQLCNTAAHRSEEQLEVGNFIIRYFKPGSDTRRLRFFPPGKEEGSWAPGHPETSGNNKRKNPFLAAGMPERGPRDSSGFVPVSPAHPAELDPSSRVPR